MVNITYVKGDATNPQGGGLKVICHCVNDIGAWGAGFVVALSNRWPLPEKCYRDRFKTGEMVLGEVTFVQVEPETWVANIVGQHGIGHSNGPPIRYSALQEGLAGVQHFCSGGSFSVHMPRMGAGLAGGKWDIIEKLVQTELVDKGINVTVYDL